MTLPTTERQHDRATGLDALPPAAFAQALAEAQAQAAQVVADASRALADAAQAMADSVRKGGRLIYCGAGSSGMMAACDALELHGTFGIPEDQIAILLAGGMPQGSALAGDIEDDTASAEAAIARAGPDDILIAVSASGTTPFTLAAMRAATGRIPGRIPVIGIANNPGTALLDGATYPVCLPSPPEIIAGSTRLGAGTAQKIALNTLSTLMAALLGHIHEGRMVNVIADNAKLRARAEGMVADIARVGPDTAASALQTANGRVKPAVLIAAGAADARHADRLISETQGNLRAALARL